MNTSYGSMYHVVRLFFFNICSACKQYFEKYPGDHDLLWEVEGAGHWFQRTPITTILQREILKMTGKHADA